MMILLTDIVRLLHRCDKEIFSGYQQYKVSMPPKHLRSIQRCPVTELNVVYVLN